MNKAVIMLKLPDVCSWAVTHYVSLSLTCRKSSVHQHALYSSLTALRTFTPRRDQLVIWGQYLTQFLHCMWVLKLIACGALVGIGADEIRIKFISGPLE
jgi:hypothetical protein